LLKFLDYKTYSNIKTRRCKILDEYNKMADLVKNVNHVVCLKLKQSDEYTTPFTYTTNLVIDIRGRR